MSSFRLEWRDFSGGEFVGPVDAEQPRNTWTGVGMTVSPADGMLMPAAPVEQVTPTGATIELSAKPQGQISRGRPVVVSSTWQPTGGTQAVIVWPYSEGSGTSDLAMIATNGSLAVKATLDAGGGGEVIATASPIGVPILTDGRRAKVYMPASLSGSGSPRMYVYDCNAALPGAISNYVLPARIGILAHWQYWLVGSSYLTNRLHFSDALTYDSAWPSANYIDIGGPSPITALVPVNNQLYVGKEDGWYVVTGELGFDTEFVRQIEVGVGPINDACVDSMLGILFERPDFGIQMLAQAGLRHRVVNYARPQSPTIAMASPVNAMARMIVAGNAPDVEGTDPDRPTTAAWVLDGRQWTRVGLPGGFGNQAVVRDCTHFRTSGATEYVWMLAPGRNSTSSSPSPATLHRWRTRLADPLPGSSASARLSEARRAGAGRDLLDFSVRSAIVEVEVPPDATGTVSVGFQLHVRGIRDSSNDGQIHPVSPQVQSWSAASFGGVRSRPTFTVQFGGAPVGNAVVPIVTLTGLKLRRVVLVCEDQDQS